MKVDTDCVGTVQSLKTRCFRSRLSDAYRVDWERHGLEIDFSDELDVDVMQGELDLDSNLVCDQILPPLEDDSILHVCCCGQSKSHRQSLHIASNRLPSSRLQ